MMKMSIEEIIIEVLATLRIEDAPIQPEVVEGVKNEGPKLVFAFPGKGKES